MLARKALGNDLPKHVETLSKFLEGDITIDQFKKFPRKATRFLGMTGSECRALNQVFDYTHEENNYLRDFQSGQCMKRMLILVVLVLSLICLSFQISNPDLLLFAKSQKKNSAGPNSTHRWIQGAGVVQEYYAH